MSIDVAYIRKRDEIRQKIEVAIIAEIDRNGHYCIAYGEGQACCIDPRCVDERGYGGEAVKAGLIERLVDIAEREGGVSDDGH